MCFCLFKQKTAYEMRISDWSSDVCSSDLVRVVTQDVAILGGPRLGLVGVAEDALLHAAVLGHEAPLQAGREACTAATAQAGLLDHLDHVGRRDLLGQDPAQRLVTAGLEEIGRAAWRARVGQSG